MNVGLLKNIINQARTHTESFLDSFKKQQGKAKIALASLLASGALLGGIKNCDKESEEKKIEKTEISYQQNSYRDWEQRDAKITHLPRETLAPWVKVIRDQGMSFYIVQAGDCLSTIRHKLSKIKEFSYLKDEKYALQDKGRNINSFNVPSDLEAGMFIPIPLASEQRETGYEEFYQMSLQAVEEMKDDPNYGTAIKKILKSVNKEEMATTMCAYARSETAQDWKNFSDNIGSVTLHRREPHMESFSFSHYHILMEKNKDGSAWPGLKARQKLGLTEGQTYHPKNGGRLFLAYWIEKNKCLQAKNRLNLADLFRVKNLQQATKFWKIYNGSKTYGQKLWANTQYCQEKANS